MIKFSEYVSLGHPDKIADYISQYFLDRYIEQDPQTRYAVEVQIKDWQVTLGGEVSSEHPFNPQGYTALWLLSESHFAVHTFPEFGKSYIELSSCNLEYYQKFLSMTKEI